MLEDVKAKAALLDGPAAEGVNDSLALLALQERRADVLRFCLDTMGSRRFSFQALFVFRDEADTVDAMKDPKTIRVLEESQFRKQYPLVPRYVTKRHKRAGAPPGAAATFDVGGRLPVHW